MTEIDARLPVTRLADLLGGKAEVSDRSPAETEADRRYPELLLAPENEQLAEAFVAGSHWAVERLPSRDEIAAISEEHVQCIDWGTEKFEGACFCGWEGEPDEFDHHFADAVLAQIRQRLEA